MKTNIKKRIEDIKDTLGVSDYPLTFDQVVDNIIKIFSLGNKEESYVFEQKTDFTTVNGDLKSRYTYVYLNWNPIGTVESGKDLHIFYSQTYTSNPYKSKHTDLIYRLYQLGSRKNLVDILEEFISRYGRYKLYTKGEVVETL